MSDPADAGVARVPCGHAASEAPPVTAPDPAGDLVAAAAAAKQGYMPRLGYTCPRQPCRLRAPARSRMLAGIVGADCIRPDRRSMDNSSPQEIRAKLEQLRLEHRDLDIAIGRLAEDLRTNELQLKRLKKRKLQLKDYIAKLESQLIPDLDA